MNLTDVNETLRELCSLGDINMVRQYMDQYRPDVNSKNKVNGWTALHWAVKKNHVSVIKFLIDNGAAMDAVNNDGRKASFYAKDKSIKEMLNDTDTEVEQQTNEQAKFIPSFLKTPEFHYSKNYGLLDATPTNSTPTPSAAPLHTAAIQQPKSVVTHNTTQSIITIKVRIQFDTDFIELDIDNYAITMQQFKRLCATELQINEKDILKIRKLPNVLIRNETDLRRLKNDQEIEICLNQ